MFLLNISDQLNGFEIIKSFIHISIKSNYKDSVTYLRAATDVIVFTYET